MPLKNILKNEALNGTVTSDDILGKDVIDIDGGFIGVIEKIHLTSQVEVTGITIDRGFFKKGLYIGQGYIKRVTPYALFLNIKPSFLLKGLPVFDVQGSRIGIVSSVVLSEETNKLQSIIVRSQAKSATIKADLIESIGDGIFLNKKKQDLEAG